MSAARRAELLAAIGLFVGCPAGPDLNSHGTDGPAAEIGTGTTSWAPVEEGQVLPVERGSQGGVHVRGAVRTWGVVPGSADDVAAWTNNDRPTLDFALSTEEGRLSITDPIRRALRPGDDGGSDLFGVIVQFHPWVVLPEDWSGIDWVAEEARLEATDLLLSVRVEDQAGVVVVDERSVRIDFPPRPGDDDDSTEDAPGR